MSVSTGPGRGLGGDEHAAHVATPGCGQVFQGEFVQRRHGQHAGVVHQDVEAAEVRGGALDGGRERVGIGAGSSARGSWTSGYPRCSAKKMTRPAKGKVETGVRYS